MRVSLKGDKWRQPEQTEPFAPSYRWTFVVVFFILNQKDEERARRREEKMEEIAARKAEKQVSNTLQS